MGSIIRVESCHDLSVQEVGVKFYEFVGNISVFICATKLAYIHNYWPTFGRWVGELAHLYKFLETTLPGILLTSHNLGKLPLFATCCCRNSLRLCLWKSNSSNAGNFGLTTLSTNCVYWRISSSHLCPSRCCCFTKFSITSLIWLAAWVVLVAMFTGSRQANRRANDFFGCAKVFLLIANQLFWRRIDHTCSECAGTLTWPPYCHCPFV